MTYFYQELETVDKLRVDYLVDQFIRNHGIENLAELQEYIDTIILNRNYLYITTDGENREILELRKNKTENGELILYIDITNDWGDGTETLTYFYRDDKTIEQNIASIRCLLWDNNIEHDISEAIAIKNFILDHELKTVKMN